MIYSYKQTNTDTCRQANKQTNKYTDRPGMYEGPRNCEASRIIKKTATTCKQLI